MRSSDDGAFETARLFKYLFSKLTYYHSLLDWQSKL